MYDVLKHLHIACVLISICGFVTRFALSMRRSAWMQATFVRVAPHAVDTLLLVAAIGMVTAGRMNPLEQPWLLAKIGGLVAYIVLGNLALKRARTLTGRSAAFAAALLAFAYVVSAALSKSPSGFIPAD